MTFTNEHDLVTYTVPVVLITQDESREVAGQTLSDWMRIVRRTLADRASDRSPLSTNPLPLSTLDLEATDACFQRVAFGPTQTDSGEEEGAFQAGGIMTVLVTLMEVATG